MLAFLWLSLPVQADSQVGFAWISWHPSGSQLLFSAIMVKKDWSDFKPENWRLILHDCDSKSSQTLENGVLFGDISPDGSQLIMSKKVDGNVNLVLRNLKSGEESLLTSGPERDSAPHFGPKGDKIAFTRSLQNKVELFIFDLKRNLATQVTNHGHKAYSPQWSGGQPELLYYLEKGDGKDQIYLLDIFKKSHQNLTSDDAHSFFPRWLGDDILFTRDEAIWRMKRDGSDKKPFIQKEGAKIGFVCFHPQTSKLAWVEKTEKETFIQIAVFKNGTIQHQQQVKTSGMNWSAASR